MSSYLNNLPIEMYQLIYKHILDECINESTRLRRLQIKHITVAYTTAHRTNRAVIHHWLIGKKHKSNRMSTDGQLLYSYQLCIGYTKGGEKVVLNHTAKGLGFWSQTTSTHVNLAAHFADKLTMCGP